MWDVLVSEILCFSEKCESLHVRLSPGIRKEHLSGLQFVFGNTGTYSVFLKTFKCTA